MCRTCTFDMEITCDMEREKLSDGKGIMGAGRLTDKAINTLQNYYGMVIRNNVGDLYGMKKSVRPTLFHNCDIANAEEKHQFCPHLRTSWSMWWSDKIAPGQNKYRKKLSLPFTIRSLLMPKFRDLSNETFPEECLSGYPQNDNVPKRCPKDVFVSKKVLEITVASATVEFNDGSNGLKPVSYDLGSNFGYFIKIVFK